ncbi:rod shape-determining protein MreC [Arcobacter porcinus]|uniref:Rod shape-determining protein MreC n=1 Tax=Arcobacter porcinus TaxID=1935204 RepID=A0A1C0AY88_9BACT|nr:rod shape-determining protein MreC [Arcobacter porcinus]OCL94445.1 rod shape-determining protein MreC [Aliarcobacter thereius]OCL83043.1 rod shape-determining protein MreC [Arcobacter porcinus]OCL83466.1 rod shape-determining protein MreC [Arcobacter porcinus]OCL88242.1 rod shape-determining protein MreC [Arcobacter porcinus]OCL92476.1 rod shape-determining protein MreC [Arcobacter porcinus]
MKRFLFLSLFIFAGLLYLFEIDEYISKQFRFFAEIKKSYLNSYIELSQKVKDHFSHEELIKKLQEENLRLKEYKILYESTTSKIDSLREFLINVELPSINAKIDIVRVLSYVKFDDFTTVWIDKKLDDEIVGLISENYAAGIALNKQGKSVGLLNGNKDCSYAVFVGNDRNSGIVMSNDSDERLLSVKFIPIWAKVNLGDEVITSGLDNIFYEGVRVGKVVDIKEYPDMKVAYIEPYAKPLTKRYFYTYQTINE